MKEIYFNYIVWTKDGKQKLTYGHWMDFDYSKLHRLDGPAVEQANGAKHWYINGKRHRLDGPAIEWSNGTKEWWVNGNWLDTEKMESWLKENKVDLSEPEGQMAFKLRWI